MPKDSKTKAKRAAVLGVHNNPATFRAVLDRSKFAKGETMHIVGIGNGDWKLAEAAPKVEEVVDQHGGFIGKLTPSQRSVWQNGCDTCDPATAGTCVDCVALREKGLE